MGYHRPMSSHAEQHTSQAIPVVKDPVCGMDVDPATSEYRSEYDGHEYYFCSRHCQARFEADPETYLEPQVAHDHAHHSSHPSHRASATVPVGEVEEWTCPMHPEIRQPGPGSCPICGMALEPVVVSADTGPSAELSDMTRRFWVGVALTIPVLILGVGGDLVPAVHRVGSATASTWGQLVLATPVVLWAGWPFFQRGWTSVRTMKLNMFTLIAMGTGVAWLFSVVATVVPDIFPDSFRASSGMADGMGAGAVDVY